MIPVHNNKLTEWASFRMKKKRKKKRKRKEKNGIQNEKHPTLSLYIDLVDINARIKL